MPKYDVIHKETGETKIIEVSVHDITQWYEDNPEWKRDWSQGCASAQDIGEWKDKLRSKAPGWNNVLQKAASIPGSRVETL